MSFIRLGQPTATVRCDEAIDDDCNFDFEPLYDVEGWSADWTELDWDVKLKIIDDNSWHLIDMEDGDEPWVICPECWAAIRSEGEREPVTVTINDDGDEDDDGFWTAWGYATRYGPTKDDDCPWDIDRSYSGPPPSVRGVLTVVGSTN